MDRSTPPPAGRFRRFVSARSLGTLVRITVTAAVLFQLLLRGIALPEPVSACGTNGRTGPHVHLTGHPHHHHDHRGHGHDRHHEPADHDTDALYLDASLVIAPPDGRILLPADDVLISWVELTATACPAATGNAGLHTLALGGPPPDFRGLFPHRLQV